MNRKITVLVVDDSFLMRKVISDIINSDEALEVIGKAKDGQEALDKIVSLSPDVVTLDLNLPVVDGIDVLTRIMKFHPTRIIMFSAYTRSGASATMRALELGAVDFIAKPSGEISLGLDKLKAEITTKIKLAAEVNLDKYIVAQGAGTAIASTEAGAAVRNLVVIGASTGGPKAILELVQGLNAKLPAAFLIVQHMPKGFTMSFAERISWQSGMRAKEAEEGDELSEGKILVAPAGYHMTLDRDRRSVRVHLNQDPLVNFVRPSIDVTMFSAAEVFGKNCVAVVLTGMGKDGADGSRKVKEAGGAVIIQDEKSSVVWGMPRSVFKEGVVDAVLPISEIPDAIARFVNAAEAGVRG
ncbi:MAG TPA: chemotaxis response regulator protein-glutamate methylesterase [Candidatus Omnitrophota bacterium]|nr:chemotaxis response regulator protein-glutamate methylesterase [Candidatus Omnitrophota bacterium]HQJ15067.1 chemotaxis response regulator protein-glutamate methylesterase [Candidatus Omnitrophota bacterium]